jgi:uncharacterized Zn-finger protein
MSSGSKFDSNHNHGQSESLSPLQIVANVASAMMRETNTGSGVRQTTSGGVESAASHASSATESALGIAQNRRDESIAGKSACRVGAPIAPTGHASAAGSAVIRARRDTRYACPHCDKNPATKYKLERHLRTHTGEKPFGCEVCLSRFNQKSSLKTHSNIHAKAFMRVRSHTKDAIEKYRVNGNSLESLGYPVQAYFTVHMIGVGPTADDS